MSYSVTMVKPLTRQWYVVQHGLQAKLVDIFVMDGKGKKLRYMAETVVPGVAVVSILQHTLCAVITFEEAQ